MTQSEKFINWLEGYLDASKNSLNSNQIKEIRKKISEYNKNTVSQTIPLWDSTTTFNPNILKPSSGVITNVGNVTYTTPVNEEYLKEIERNKNASTMEELV